MFLDTFLIVVIYVIGIDVLCFWDEISSYLSYIITKGKVKKPIEIKPFCCSTCMAFWTNVLYIMITSQFSLIGLFWVAILAFLTPSIKEILLKVEELIIKLVNKI